MEEFKLVEPKYKVPDDWSLPSEAPNWDENPERNPSLMEPGGYFQRTRLKNDIHAHHGRVYARSDEIEHAKRADAQQLGRKPAWNDPLGPATQAHVETFVTQTCEMRRVRFPLKRWCMTPAEVRSHFMGLVSLRPVLERGPYVLKGYLSEEEGLNFWEEAGKEVEKVEGGIHSHVDRLRRFEPLGVEVLIPQVDDHVKFAALSDYFGEHARMRSRRPDEPGAPGAMFFVPEFAGKIATAAVRKYGELSEFSLRYSMFAAIKGCNVFKTEGAKTLYELFGAKSVVDPSAGWGDRLMGALASNCVERYVGFDPNSSLQSAYRAMTVLGSQLVRKSPEKFQVLPGPFETTPFPSDSETFDLAFTSPPFFDLEIYESGDAGADANQSAVRHSSPDRWMNDFLFVLLQRAWNVLRPGGHLAIYINDVKGRPPICKPMLEWAHDNLEHANFLGCIGLEVELKRKPGLPVGARPIWIWRKGDIVDSPPIYSYSFATLSEPPPAKRARKA